MIAQQISIFAENKAGRLAAATHALANGLIKFQYNGS